MSTYHDDDYVALVNAVKARQWDAPTGLAFWLSNVSEHSGEHVWAECPRGEWLLWMAERMGCSESFVATIRAGFQECLETAREQRWGGMYTPHQTGAAFVRQRLGWQTVRRQRRAVAAA